MQAHGVQVIPGNGLPDQHHENRVSCCTSRCLASMPRRHGARPRGHPPPAPAGWRGRCRAPRCSPRHPPCAGTTRRAGPVDPGAGAGSTHRARPAPGCRRPRARIAPPRHPRRGKKGQVHFPTTRQGTKPRAERHRPPAERRSHRHAGPNLRSGRSPWLASHDSIYPAFPSMSCSAATTGINAIHGLRNLG